MNHQVFDSIKLHESPGLWLIHNSLYNTRQWLCFISSSTATVKLLLTNNGCPRQLQKKFLVTPSPWLWLINNHRSNHSIYKNVIPQDLSCNCPVCLVHTSFNCIYRLNSQLFVFYSTIALKDWRPPAWAEIQGAHYPARQPYRLRWPRDGSHQSHPLSLIICASSMMYLPSLYFWLDSNACSWKNRVKISFSQNYMHVHVHVHYRSTVMSTVLPLWPTCRPNCYKLYETPRSNVILWIYRVSKNHTL